MELLSWIIASILAFLSAITIHEASHAWMAYKLGDSTAKNRGRLTLNPIAHMDIYGTVIIPLTLILIKSPLVFGWAKPVVFNPSNLRNPRKDTALISLAGPASNMLFAVIIAIGFNVFVMFMNIPDFVSLLIYLTLRINIVLAVFNFIPIHPLDGGKILIALLPEKDAVEADAFLHRYGMFILFFLIFPSIGGMSPLSAFINPIINFFLKIFLPN